MVNCGITVPTPQEETVNVKLVPDDALIEKVQPAAVPAFVKSPFSIPVTFCDITIEYVKALAELVGVVCVVEKVVGVGAFR